MVFRAHGGGVVRNWVNVTSMVSRACGGLVGGDRPPCPGPRRPYSERSGGKYPTYGVQARGAQVRRNISPAVSWVRGGHVGRGSGENILPVVSRARGGHIGRGVMLLKLLVGSPFCVHPLVVVAHVVLVRHRTLLVLVIQAKHCPQL